MFLNFKQSTSFTGLFQINGKGPWRNEYKTYGLLTNGVYEVIEDGVLVGFWNQSTLHHEFKAL